MGDTPSDPPDHDASWGSSTGTDPSAFPSSSAFQLRADDTEVALLPGDNQLGEEIIWCVFSAPLVDMMPDERGPNTVSDMPTVELADVPTLRDSYERQRDLIRNRDDPPSHLEPTPAALQDGIDLLTVIEHAVGYVRSTDPDAREQHFRRVSALCQDPNEVVVKVEEALVEHHHRKANNTLRHRFFAALSTMLRTRLGNLGKQN